ncbi:hypothetical protein [Gemmatimonas sp.]|uniref:hypothetical protein n=1 Tax=Gemmatimonas sp. TaxID=1962908 RepID=UPI00286DAC16|nr:hypothetical protein [Gemmatimonas sp.]
MLKPELAAVLGAERFMQEIMTTAALRHPHILLLFDSGAADGNAASCVALRRAPVALVDVGTAIDWERIGLLRDDGTEKRLLRHGDGAEVIAPTRA